MQNYILIGGGGTGSHFIAQALPYLDSHHRDEEWQFIVIDGDAYESQNLERQMFDPSLVSVNKAIALAQMYSRYPVIPVDRFIGRDDLAQMMQEDDTVFLGVDNYSIRKLVEERALQLKNTTILNAGNEEHDGSVQLWVRRDGKNLTPRLSYGHQEIVYSGPEDRAGMSCQQVAAMPGGGQLIIANAAAANHMLSALWRLHTDRWQTGWTELQFDLSNGEVIAIDMRERKKWDLDG